MNLTMLPMWVLSGVFFSSENFPRVVQPFIKALPLTATNDALRANMLRGVDASRAVAAARGACRLDGGVLRDRAEDLPVAVIWGMGDGGSGRREAGKRRVSSRAQRGIWIIARKNCLARGGLYRPPAQIPRCARDDNKARDDNNARDDIPRRLECTPPSPIPRPPSPMVICRARN